MIETSPEKIEAVLTRTVEDIFVKEHLRQAMASGRQLRVKFGIDPTSSSIHIGRAVVLWKLREFQELGHKVVLIVGDFTAQIGDPSDKLEKRPMLSEENVAENLKKYTEIISKVIDIKKAEIVHNSQWLSKLTFKEISLLAESFSVQQLSGRRNFKERLEKGQEISLREFLYPLMQGYDSVAVKADVELGGVDQLFNVKAGRLIQKHYGLPEQDILVTAMLEGIDGRKMSSSWGNVISITDEPNDMFGKVMAVRDDLILKYFKLCTRLPLEEISAIESQLADSKTNPRDVKLRLAREIVSLYHGTTEAESAAKAFIETFSEGKIPADIKKITVQGTNLLADVVVQHKILPSKAQWRRLVIEGAIARITEKNQEKITDPFAIAGNGVYRIGKKTFIQLEIS